MLEKYLVIIFAIIFSIYSIITSYRMKDSDDPLLVLKLIGLYFLSITIITINSKYPVPVGFFAAFTLAVGTKHNLRSKKACTLLGLSASAACLIMYSII